MRTLSTLGLGGASLLAVASAFEAWSGQRDADFILTALMFSL